jgi:glc operon protein GlcG
MPDLTLAHAQRLSGAACDAARDLGVPVTIAVTDSGGHLVSLARMDGAPFITTEFAIGKAFTAACFGVPSADVAERFEDRAQLTTAVQVATQGRFVIGAGGLPIIVDGGTVGGIGASGGTTAQDVSITHAALTAEGAADSDSDST